jgi:hypothetical protein
MMSGKKPSDKLVDRIGQFTTIPNSVIELWSELGMDAMGLFMYFRYRSDKNDSCWPSYDCMQKDTGLSRQRISDALKVLEEKGLLERERRFSNSTVYIIKLPLIGAEKADPSPLPKRKRGRSSLAKSATKRISISRTGRLMRKRPLVAQVDCSSNTGRLPLVAQVDTNQIHINQIHINQIKNMGAEAPVQDSSKEKNPLEQKTDPQKESIVKNQSAYDALLKFERDHPKGGLDLSSFPEDTRLVIGKVCELWKLKPPSKNGKKGGEYSLWIQDARQLSDACGEYGVSVLEAVFRAWRASFKAGIPPFTVGRPGALIKMARAKGGEFRSGLLHLPGTEQSDEEGFDAEIHEEMVRGRERNRLLAASARNMIPETRNTDDELDYDPEIRAEMIRGRELRKLETV